MTSVGAESGQPFVVSLLGFGWVPKEGHKQGGIINTCWFFLWSQMLMITWFGVKEYLRTQL
jgi:hypothetical protein